MAVLLAVAWRFFDRSPDDRLIDGEALAASPVLSRLARHRIAGWTALALLLAAALLAAIALHP
jgi:hypothetical protein